MLLFMVWVNETFEPWLYVFFAMGIGLGMILMASTAEGRTVIGLWFHEGSQFLNGTNPRFPLEFPFFFVASILIGAWFLTTK
jgi:hypothetical protein